MPIGQAHDVLAFHGLEQFLAFRAQLETVHGGDVIKQERQVKQLHRLGVLLELGQRRRDHLYIAQQQGFHLLAVAEQ
ncbi:hypothetical protein D3C78_1290350 [compost metagenome]